jgi:hypothetical protein
MKYTITIDAEMHKVLTLALGELPTKIGMAVVLEINRQITEQQKPKLAPAADEKDAA